MLPDSDGYLRTYIRRAVDAKIPTALLSIQPLRASIILPNGKNFTILKLRVRPFKMLDHEQITKAPTPKSGTEEMTAFEPHDGLRNIMITGGGGFM
jgi:hypothetical protein